MYDMTPEQATSEKVLKKQGFRFSNWISANGYGVDNEEKDEKHGCMVMTKRGEQRQIDPDGSIN